jgi:hypothetical protein
MSLVIAALAALLATPVGLLSGCRAREAQTEADLAAQKDEAPARPAPEALLHPVTAIRGMTSRADVIDAWGQPRNVTENQEECGTALDEEHLQDFAYPDALIEVGRSGDAIIRALRGIPDGLTIKLEGVDVSSASTLTQLKKSFGKNRQWKEAEAPGNVRTPSDRGEEDPLDQLYYNTLYTLDGDGDQWRFYFLGERLVGYAYWVGC